MFAEIRMVLQPTMRGIIWGTAVGLGFGYVLSPSGSTECQRPCELDGPTSIIIGFVLFGAIVGMMLGLLDGIRAHFAKRDRCAI
jgi:RsiW-degrading membrane proteinase PrsW (M82 family)